MQYIFLTVLSCGIVVKSTKESLTTLSKYEEISPVFDLPACSSLAMCHPIRKQTLQPATLDTQARSYYNSFGFPTYYPTFDPISVLATLAFLAFLVQSFASLFDRSRTIIPTISKQSADYDQFGEVEKRVLRALNDYDTLDNLFVADKKSIHKINQ